MSGTTSIIGTAPVFYKTLVGYRQVRTQFRDTLLAVAVRELQDASQWATIAAINGLVPPYITDNPMLVSDNVVLSGSSIFVPAPAPAPSAVSDSGDIFGVDLMLAADHSGGDFVGVLQDDGAGDFLTIAGEDNLEQALYNRLGTRPGDLIFHLPYGCKVYTLLGKMAGPAAGVLATAWITQALLSDARVSKVEGLQATISADVIALQSGSVVPITGKRLPIGISQLPGA